MWWSVEPGREVFSTWRETSDRLPRGRARPPPADRHGDLPARTRSTTSSGCSPAPRRTPRAGRCTPSGWSANWATSTTTASLLGHARLPAVPGGPGGRRHRHAPASWRSRPAPGSTRASAGPASSGSSSCSPGRSPTRRTAATRSTATSAGPGRRRRTRSASGSGCEGRDAARARHGDAFDFKAFHTAALNMGGMGLDPLLGLLANDLTFRARSGTRHADTVGARGAVRLRRGVWGAVAPQCGGMGELARRRQRLGAAQPLIELDRGRERASSERASVET